MALPRLIFDGVNVDFPQEVSGFEKLRKVRAKMAFSASGVSSKITEHLFDEVEIEVDNFADRAFYRRLQAWWAHAAQGKPYAFALDGADVVDTTIDGDAASGQKVIPLADTTGVLVGKFYRLRTADSLREEVIQVDSVSAGVSATAVENLIYSYASGDIFRSEDYFPKVVSLDDEFPAEEKPTLTFNFKHKFREAK